MVEKDHADCLMERISADDDSLSSFLLMVHSSLPYHNIGLGLIAVCLFPFFAHGAFVLF
jgi:hypothetical protein